MKHVFGDNPHKQHRRSLAGCDQMTNIEGRRVRDCEGKQGSCEGPHCSYGITVRWDDGTRYYADSACLEWEESKP